MNHQASTSPDDYSIETLGEPEFRSPLALSTHEDDEVANFMPDDTRVLANVEARAGESIDTRAMFERAGPREKLFFDPARTRAGLVTCGGLCPGLNNVIQGMVRTLHHGYHVRDIIGYRYGYEGLNRERGVAPVTLTSESVNSIHQRGGSVLGVGRGGEDPATIVSTLEANDVQVLFCIGGDGTLAGAHAIKQEVTRRGARIAIVGVPKTIDNDIACVDKTFGFDTAVEVAKQAIDGAHTEASSARNGIGLVKLMGRDAGFIAAAATLASQEVNFCLVPEVHFQLGGQHGLLLALERRLRERGHAVIVVAEGCAQRLVEADSERDASGNLRYSSAELDIGPYLAARLKQYLADIELPHTLKYIDPSYMVRSVPAGTTDAVFCDMLARRAVHAALAGKTDLVIGHRHNRFVHVPLTMATSARKHIDPDGNLWLAVTEATGQPTMMNQAPQPAGEA